MRKHFGRVVLLLLSLAASAVLMEGLCTAYAWWKFGTIDVVAIERIRTGDAEPTNNPAEVEGRSATLYPHPYLDYVRNEKVQGPNPAQTTQRLNNVGLIGRDIPLKKDETKFTILLSGGSVAQFFGSAGVGGQSYLEEILNRDYAFEKPVVVLNGANGAWLEPHQAIMFLLYGEVADAYVTLDGVNERKILLGNARRLEHPPDAFAELNPIAVRGYGPLAASWQAQEWRRFSLDAGWRTTYFFSNIMRARLQRASQAAPPGISVHTLFALPSQWSKDERIAYNLAAYKKYVRSIDALGKLHGAKRAFFIQPCPAINKPLTKDELAVVGDINGYRATYEKMAGELLSLREDGIPVVSLMDAFATTTETVYADFSHCRFEPATDFSHPVNFQPSPGYKIMAELMAARMAKEWGIPKR